VCGPRGEPSHALLHLVARHEVPQPQVAARPDTTVSTIR
jgi:hypothetical protein